MIEKLQPITEKYSRLGSWYAYSVFELSNCVQLAQNCFPSSDQFPKELERLVEVVTRHKMGDFFKEFEKVNFDNSEKFEISKIEVVLIFSGGCGAISRFENWF